MGWLKLGNRFEVSYWREGLFQWLQTFPPWLCTDIHKFTNIKLQKIITTIFIPTINENYIFKWRLNSPFWLKVFPWSLSNTWIPEIFKTKVFHAWQSVICFEQIPPNNGAVNYSKRTHLLVICEHISQNHFGCNL